MRGAIEVITGLASGVAVGLALRLAMGTLIAPVEQVVKSAPPAVEPAHANPPTAVAEIRQATESPSAEARAAVEGGAIKFIIRGGANADESEVATILLQSGALPLCHDGQTISIWNVERWEPLRTLDQLSQYAVGRAWELTRHASLGPAGNQLPASASIVLVMPIQQEMRLVGAVERALASPLINHSRIELAVEKTPGGHIRWTLQRAIRRDNSQLLPNIILPI